ncbi:sugar phosphate isomerase/epimerase family protein [Alkalibacterium sp. 20]|uniref:sugar phosphate isomerase/epimerase family protein n=1 Tax=Alkalibacterium sp. 20 TaxID=1798803 RepID=UPI0008FFFA0B|nr:sugar phosphate isomerase/epimerase family protein [Alkalibacterium sp. 20]OJF90325.1 hypothetical protein AX762_04375 [Alkalibacterium sp. 20]
MSNFYLSTPLMWNNRIEEIFQSATEYQMGLEIFHQQMEFHNIPLLQLQRLIEKYERKVYVHALSWDLNLCSLQKSARELAIVQTKKSIDFAQSLGALDVTIHPGRMSIFLEETSYDGYMHDSMKELLEYADSLEQSISFEIMEPIGKEFITSRHVMERVARDLWEQLSVTLDLAHCQNNAVVLDHLEHLPRISKLHMSNLKNGKYHTPIGEGELDFHCLKPTISESGLPIVIEGMDTDTKKELFRKNVRYLKEEY